MDAECVHTHLFKPFPAQPGPENPRRCDPDKSEQGRGEAGGGARARRQGRDRMRIEKATIWSIQSRQAGPGPVAAHAARPSGFVHRRRPCGLGSGPEASG